VAVVNVLANEIRKARFLQRVVHIVVFVRNFGTHRSVWLGMYDVSSLRRGHHFEDQTIAAQCWFQKLANADVQTGVGGKVS
jgi:hypothetical protein